MSSRGFHRFTDVDASEQTAEFVSFLERIRALPQAMERRARAYEQLRLRPGQRVLDAGCGLGEDTRELAQLVAPGGEAVGIDLSEALLAEAGRRNHMSAATFVHGSVTDLPFDDASFDAYRAERLHQHLVAPEAAMAEAARVLRAGGRIAIVDQDWESLLVDAADRALTREIVNAFADSFANGWSGRRLYGQLLDAGFDAEVEVVPVPSASAEIARTVMLPGLADAARGAGVDGEQLDHWLAEQHARVDSGRFFAAFSFVLASGTRR